MLRLIAKSLNLLAERTGLEPATPGVTGRTTNLALARPAGEFDIPRIAAEQ
jgi:hypothetical protein